MNWRPCQPFHRALPFLRWGFRCLRGIEVTNSCAGVQALLAASWAIIELKFEGRLSELWPEPCYLSTTLVPSHDAVDNIVRASRLILSK